MAIDNTQLKQKIKIQEGCIEHMYLDTRGFVTTGVGQLLSRETEAADLAFIREDSGIAANKQEIVDEYNFLKKQRPGLIASRYKQFTKLILPKQAIDEMLEQQIKYFQNGIIKEISDYPDFPDEAQEALLDMAFNLGISGLFKKFPTMIRAAKRRDWKVCAKECNRRGIGEDRNKETVALFLRAGDR
jgi:GH24 family phage-related lysozyme (muramidase)